MRIAVTATGPDLDAQIDPRFGRCAYFIFVDTDTMEFEAVPNPYVSAMGGAGIQAAQLVANKGATAVLSGAFGPNAAQTLSAVGVQMYPNVMGTVREAVEKFKRGELQPAFQPTAPPYAGMGPGAGWGMRRGMGRGRGGWAAGMGFTPPQPVSQQDIESLKQQAKSLSQQLEEIRRRIEELERQKGKG